MCKDCGCQEALSKIHSHGPHGHEHTHGPHSHEHSHERTHGHEHGHEHSHHHGSVHSGERSSSVAVTHAKEGASCREASHTPQHVRTVEIRERVLSKNEDIAKSNRAWFERHGIRVLNLISSPGSGKTRLLEESISRVTGRAPMSILTADVERDFDAKRLEASGGRVRQLNTQGACHLDAQMIEKELGVFVRAEPGILVIENVGNLVCPAAFELGEHERIALLSVTEGEDKPLKYPLLFHTASLVLITKMDLVPYLDFNLDRCMSSLREICPTTPVLQLSARSGEGMSAWIDFLLRGSGSDISRT